MIFLSPWYEHVVHFRYRKPFYFIKTTGIDPDLIKSTECGEFSIFHCMTSAFRLFVLSASCCTLMQLLNLPSRSTFIIIKISK
jgi:hypothetical protein